MHSVPAYILPLFTGHAVPVGVVLCGVLRAGAGCAVLCVIAATLPGMQSLQEASWEAEEYVRHHQVAAIAAFAATIGACGSLVQDALDP